MTTDVSVSLEDNRTMQAIGILADVLDGLSGPGVLDTVLVSKALRQVIATRSQPAFEFAARAFSTLDPRIKRQVALDAEHAARDAAELRGRVTGLLSKPPTKPGAKPGPRPQPSTQPTGLLAALNTRMRTGGKPKDEG